MGEYICYTDPDGGQHSEILDLNGKADALLGLFAVGYSASRRPDARRARNSVEMIGGAREANPGVKIPFSFDTADDVKKIIALDGGNRFWAKFNVQAAGIGWFSGRPKCETFQAILLPILLSALCDGRVLIPPNADAPVPVDPRLLRLKQMVLDTVVAKNSKRNYGKAIDHLLAFAASRPLNRELLLAGPVDFPLKRQRHSPTFQTSSSRGRGWETGLRGNRRRNFWPFRIARPSRASETM